MTTGDDASPDWILCSLDPGDATNTVQKDFLNPGLTTTLTAEFQVFFTPTTGLQEFEIDFVDSGSGDDILGIGTSYAGTGGGSTVTGVMYDTGDDSGDQPITMAAGFIHTIKVTYDGTDVKFYVDGALQFTWTHVLDHAISLISRVFARMHWSTGPGQNMEMKGLRLSPGIL